MSNEDDNNKLSDNIIQKDKEEVNNDLKTSANLAKDPPKEYIIEKLPDNTTEYDKSIKVILLGDSNVGKTSILNCLEKKDILQQKTMSLEYFNLNIKINNYTIRMQIWDTVGQEKFNSIIDNYYKTTDIVIFVYAINDLKSFNNIENWLEKLKEKGGSNSLSMSNTNEIMVDKNMIKILVGNKKDLHKERKVSYQMGEKLKKENNVNLFKEISCEYENNEAILDDNSSDNIKEEEILNIEKINENENNDENIIEKDCIKNLFFEIGKIAYQEYVEDHGSRMNSSVYYYEASNSILELTPEKSESEGISTTKKKKKCCCS
jgi:Ras-related protein Rab-6A